MTNLTTPARLMLRAGLSAMVLGLSAMAALAEDEAPPPDEIAGGEAGIGDEGDGILIDPVCIECSGEPVEFVEDGLPVDDEFTGEGRTDEEALPTDPVEGEVFVSTCGGCESWSFRPDAGPSRSTDDWRNDSVAQTPNICTTPELYVSWLCEWQGYDRP